MALLPGVENIDASFSLCPNAPLLEHRGITPYPLVVRYLEVSSTNPSKQQPESLPTLPVDYSSLPFELRREPSCNLSRATKLDAQQKNLVVYTTG